MPQASPPAPAAERTKKVGPLKSMLAAHLLRLLGDSDGAVFVDPGPMTVEASTRLRTLLATKAGGARMRVVHNRTARAALLGAGWPEGVTRLLRGQTAIVFGGDGVPVISKTIVEWARTDKTFTVKGAVAEGEHYDAKGVAALARLPDKNTLRAMLAGTIAGPARGVASVLAAPGASLARVLMARIDAKGFAPDGA
jgi:large subunit ribosomal protein L10